MIGFGGGLRFDPFFDKFFFFFSKAVFLKCCQNTPNLRELKGRRLTLINRQFLFLWNIGLK
jgi:hypothetical protein